MEEDKSNSVSSARNSPMLDRSRLLTPVENPQKSGSGELLCFFELVFKAMHFVVM